MGAIINTVVVFICGLLGVVIKGGIPTYVHERIMQGIALCIVALGIMSVVQGKKALVMILSMVIGAVMGEWLDLDSKVITFTNFLDSTLSRFPKLDNVGRGFLTASMLMCIGSMSIVGAIESGMTGNDTTLISKSIIDGICALLLGSSLGIGVAFAAIPILILEGGMTLFAQFLAPLLTPDIINEIVCVGSLLLVALGMNMLEITKIKIMNLVPAIFVPIVLMQFL